MSTVDKMLIKGIRSFSPENTRVITFYRPLTLIVGANGAGKTTVIECLKHACTGELPPNSRSGQSFIHDPKVAGETETKGQIKLRFKTAAGKDVVCIRSFQLTQKASKLEYKAIESVLQTINSLTGEKVCLSYRCADMDREVPALMGVSKAILENVIFVHQDDANWPLAEGAVLKKKFDDIFSATRYTKALEVIKKLHKDQAQEIKVYKLKLENLQTLKDAAHKFQDSIHQDQETSDFLHAQIRDLERKISDTRNRISVMETGLKEVRGLQEEIRIQESKRQMLVELKTRQFQDLKEENEDADEELQTWQGDFDKTIAQLRQKQMAKERELKDAEFEIGRLIDRHSKDCTSQGKLQAEVEANAKLKKELDTEIRKVFVEHNLGNTGSHALSNEESRRLVNRVGQRFEELKTDHSKLKEANYAEVGKLWKAVQKTSDEFLEAKNKVTAKQQLKKSTEAHIVQLEEEIAYASLNISDSEFRRIEAAETKAKAEGNTLTTKLNTLQYEAKIDDGERDVAVLENKIKILRREKDVLINESSDRVELKLKKDELADKEASLRKIITDNKEAIKKTLKRLPEPKDLKREIDAAFRTSKNTAAEFSQRCSDAEKEVIKVASKMQETTTNVLKYQRDRDSKRSLLLGRLNHILQLNVEIDEFPSKLQEAVNRKDTQKSQHDMADGMRRMFDPFERVARVTHACPCCDRGFSPEEEDDFVKKQRVKASSTADRLRDLATQSSDAEIKVQQLEMLRVVHEDYQKLVKELIPAAEKALDQLAEEKARFTDAHDDLLGLLAHSNSELEMVEKLRVPAYQIMELERVIENVKKQVAEQEYKLDSRSQGVRTLDDIAAELTSLDEKREDIQQRVKKMREEHSYLKDDLASWMLKLHTAREEKFVAVNKMTELNRKKANRQKLGEEILQIDMDIEIYKQGLDPAAQKKERIEEEHSELKKAKATEEDVRLQELNYFKQGFDKLRSLRDSVQEFWLTKKEQGLKELNERITCEEAERKVKVEKLKDLQAEVSKLNEVLRNQTELKRNIDDNLQYRLTVAKEQEVRANIESLEELLVSKGDLPSLEADLKRVMGELQSLLSELNRSQGTIAVYESNVARNKADLKQSQYKDIDKRYCAQLIQLKTTEMANKDLDKYYNALDRALMRFHSMKMEEINKIVKELWQQTYRGQDIDFIEIRSDAEGVGTRSYSYRVIMRSGDAELDMRGRCSAGQKVLASLIIRLALAETFCLNCGILALDEPTTNLDTPNAESLAGALLRLMEDRKGQENFQLIVITHDERFAHLIGQRQHAERYYRISKDDHQHSIIEAQDIFD